MFPKDSVDPLLEEPIELSLFCALHISLQFHRQSPLQKIHFAHGAQSNRSSSSSPLNRSNRFTWRKYHLNWCQRPQVIAGSVGQRKFQDGVLWESQEVLPKISQRERAGKNTFLWGLNPLLSGFGVFRKASCLLQGNYLIVKSRKFVNFVMHVHFKTIPIEACSRSFAFKFRVSVLLNYSHTLPIKFPPRIWWRIVVTI